MSSMAGTSLSILSPPDSDSDLAFSSLQGQRLSCCFQFITRGGEQRVLLTKAGGPGLAVSPPLGWEGHLGSCM